MEITLVTDIKEMMEGWNKIENCAKAAFPQASKEELFKICSSAMNHALNIGKGK